MPKMDLAVGKRICGHIITSRWNGAYESQGFYERDRVGLCGCGFLGSGIVRSRKQQFGRNFGHYRCAYPALAGIQSTGTICKPA